MQTNYGQENYNIINDSIWIDIIDMIKNRSDIDKIHTYIYNISITYNIDNKNTMKHLLNYIIKHHEEYVTSKFLSFVENILHSDNINNQMFINYVLSCLYEIIV
jgi:hypothetical protein